MPSWHLLTEFQSPIMKQESWCHCPCYAKGCLYHCFFGVRESSFFHHVQTLNDRVSSWHSAVLRGNIFGHCLSLGRRSRGRCKCRQKNLPWPTQKQENTLQWYLCLAWSSGSTEATRKGDGEALTTILGGIPLHCEGFLQPEAMSQGMWELSLWGSISRALLLQDEAVWGTANTPQW